MAGVQCTTLAFGDELHQMLKLSHIHPEDGNYNVYQNFGSFLTFNVAHP
jgi:hypothetical protein